MPTFSHRLCARHPHSNISRTFTTTSLHSSAISPTQLLFIKMKFTVATALTAAAVAVAGSTESKPFTLSIVSSDKSVDGKHITWCHSGAGVNSLCLSDTKGDKITLDTEDSKVDPNKAGITGKLTLRVPNEAPAVETMQLTVDYSTNVLQALFTLGGPADWVSFNDKGYLTLTSSLDDTVNPPTTVAERPINNWHACRTHLTWGTGDHESLAFVVGGKPHNPSCVPVTVKRTFV